MKKIFEYDEMEKEVIGKACIACTITAIVYSMGVGLYKYIVTKDIYNCKYEIGLIIILAIVYSLFIKERKEMNHPKTIWGKRIPIHNDKKSVFIRRIYCALDSLVGTIIFQIIFYNVVYHAGLSYIAWESIFLYVIAYIIEYFYIEGKCKEYKEWEELLDN